MKKLRVLVAMAAGVILSGAAAHGKIITVNTINNISPGAGETSLVQAINLLADGDTIQFNIPGTGPFYLTTPPLSPNNGYPAITKNNITIDGFSQPGASQNTNPILSSNNAAIQIVLDSQTGGSHVENIPGYGSGESATLFVVGATNVTIKGLCFLGPGAPGAGTSADPFRYAISFGLNADSGHVNGCQIGVEDDLYYRYGSPWHVARFRNGITAFQGPPGQYCDGMEIGVQKNAPDVAAARAQFNVIVGEYLPVAIEGKDPRIAGNFFNVFPDGRTDYQANNTSPANAHSLEAFIEFGGATSAGMVIGTDGDGVNDAEERNIFGGVTAAADNRLLEWYTASAPRTNIVIAGNYFGVGVDGISRFTNAMVLCDGFNSTATVRIGSDFDGVSDDIEGNVIMMNYPFTTLYPNPPTGSLPPIFANLSVGARLSLRGNTLVGNTLAPYSYANGYGNKLSGYTSYMGQFLTTSTGPQFKLYAGVTNPIPVIATNSSQGSFKCSFPLGTGLYTNITIDLYVADGEGWTNGQTFGLSELFSSSSPSYYGFAQGRTCLGSFVDNGPLDHDPVRGQLDVDLQSGYFSQSGIYLLTASANYSADLPGTHNGRVHTGDFATPVAIASDPLSRIVPDIPIVRMTKDSLGNWEPYISVLGTNVFLLEANTFANDGVNQRYVVGLQPANGGNFVLAEGFYGDNGQPYSGQINASRQNGDPGRVAGDKRPGAVNYMVGGEASPHVFPAFQSDNRWSLGFDRLANGRYGTVQTFSLNTDTLVPTPLCKAQDSAFGRLATGVPAGNQISRFGGDVVCLDNGNFVSVVEDRSHVLSSNDCVTATIFAPNGAVVKDSWLVATNSDIWSNVAAYKGGFAVRCTPQVGSNTRRIYFYDNNGNLQGDISQDTSGESFDTGPGLGTRLFAHINSPYVFLAGKETVSQTIKVAAWDSRTRTFAAGTSVNDGIFTGNFDRVNGTVDALNRLTVAWVSQPNGYAQPQVAARVLSFNGLTFTPLTRSFLPFINSGPNNIRSLAMSVAMTTRQICVAAKGEINYANHPELGPDSPTEVNFFTVLQHPAPADDPTTSVSHTPPVVVNPIADVTVNQNATDTVIDLRAVFEDAETPDADLVYSVQANSNPALVSATTDNTADVLRLHYQLNQSGSAAITVRATDPDGLYAQDTFLLTVNTASPGCVLGESVLDNFDDNTKTDWEDFSFIPGFGLLVEQSGQFTFNLPPAGQDIFSASRKTSRVFDLRQCGRLQFRVDLVDGIGAGSFAVLAFIPTNNSLGTSLGTLAGYGLAKSATDILVTKGIGKYFYNENVSPAVKNNNVTLVLDLAVSNANSVVITGQVLDKDNHNAVLWQETFVDTPNADVLAGGTDSPAAPYITAGHFALYCYENSSAPPQSVYQVIYDNAIALAPVETPPTVVSPIADFAVNENDANTVIDLHTVFQDTETPGAYLVYTVQANSNPTLVSAIADNTSDTLTLHYQLNQSGSATIKVRSTDAAGLYVEDTFTVTVNANLPPISSGFSATTPINQPLLATYAALLSPITDPDGDPVHIVSVGSDPIYLNGQVIGSIELSTNGAFVFADGARAIYVPNQDFVGADRFSYVVGDNRGATSTVHAQIAVLPPGVQANAARALTASAGGVTFSFAGLPGRTYEVQRAPSATGPWEKVGEMIIQPDGSGMFVDNTPLAGSGFYRTALLP